MDCNELSTLHEFRVTRVVMCLHVEKILAFGPRISETSL